jgi:hypothetical protein
VEDVEGCEGWPTDEPTARWCNRTIRTTTFCGCDGRSTRPDYFFACLALPARGPAPHLSGLKGVGPAQHSAAARACTVGHGFGHGFASERRGAGW